MSCTFLENSFTPGSRLCIVPPSPVTPVQVKPVSTGGSFKRLQSSLPCSALILQHCTSLVYASLASIFLISASFICILRYSLRKESAVYWVSEAESGRVVVLRDIRRYQKLTRVLSKLPIYDYFILVLTEAFRSLLHPQASFVVLSTALPGISGLI